VGVDDGNALKRRKPIKLNPPTHGFEQPLRCATAFELEFVRFGVIVHWDNRSQFLNAEAAKDSQKTQKTQKTQKRSRKEAEKKQPNFVFLFCALCVIFASSAFKTTFSKML
jgi:hypothetical protein